MSISRRVVIHVDYIIIILSPTPSKDLHAVKFLCRERAGLFKSLHVPPLEPVPVTPDTASQPVPLVVVVCRVDALSLIHI